MTSISSRSEGTSSKSTSEKTRAISLRPCAASGWPEQNRPPTRTAPAETNSATRREPAPSIRAARRSMSGLQMPQQPQQRESDSANRKASRESKPPPTQVRLSSPFLAPRDRLPSPDAPGRGSRSWARARSRRTFFRKPRIHRLPAKPDVVERQRAQAELSHQHRPGCVESLHDDGVFTRNAIPIGLGAIRGGNARRVEQILHAKRNPMQRPAIFSLRDFFIGLLRLFHCLIARDRNGTPQLGIESFQSLQINAREPLRTELLAFDPARELSHGRERNVFIFGGKGNAVGLAAHESVLRHAIFHTRNHRVPFCGWRQR